MRKIQNKALLSIFLLFTLFSHANASEKLTYENIKGCWESKGVYTPDWIKNKKIKIYNLTFYCFNENGVLNFSALDHEDAWDGTSDWKIENNTLFIDKKNAVFFLMEKK